MPARLPSKRTPRKQAWLPNARRKKLTGFCDNDGLPQVEAIRDNADVAQDRRVQYSAGDRPGLLDDIERDHTDANAFERHPNEGVKPP